MPIASGGESIRHSTQLHSRVAKSTKPDALWRAYVHSCQSPSVDEPCSGKTSASFVPRYLPNYTVADHAASEGQWELLGGVAVAMTPSSFGRHAQPLSRPAAALCNAIDAAGCQATVLGGIDWIVSDDAAIRPNLVVFCG